MSDQSEVNLQEQSNINVARSHQNTAEFLSQKAAAKSAEEFPDSIGQEIELQQLQQKLYRGNFSSPLEEQQLIMQTEALAAKLVGASEEVRDQSSTDPNPAWTEEDLADDLQAGLASDPETVRTLEWFADPDHVSTEVAQSINTGLAEADDPVAVQSAVTAMNQIRNNPSMVSTAEEVSGLDTTAIDYFNTEFSPQVSRGVQALNAALLAGHSRGDVMKTAMANPELLQAMLQASSDPSSNFKLAL